VLQRPIEVFLQVVLQRTKQQKLRLRAVSAKQASATLSIDILLFKTLGEKKILDAVKSQETFCVVFWYWQRTLMFFCALREINIKNGLDSTNRNFTVDRYSAIDIKLD